MSDRRTPAVPHVLILGERGGAYLPPALTRAGTVYATPTTVRVLLPGGRQETQQQHKVWAVPDDPAWAEIEAAVAGFGAALAALAATLRELGSYPSRLAEAGGTRAQNPICPSVARISDPDHAGTSWWLDAWYVPRLERTRIARHTPKMLSAGDTGAYTFSQRDCFVLVDDAAWERLAAAHAAASAAATTTQALLRRLGTYAEALDGRHAAQAARALGSATALVVAEPAIEGIPVMTRAEARAAADRIIAAVDDLRRLIDTFDQARGWEALGHDSFRAWALAEIPDTSLRHVYRLRDAAEVDRSLGVAVGHTPESHARELRPVAPERRPDVLRQADERAAQRGRERTAEDVRQAARGVTIGHTEDAPLTEAELVRLSRLGGWEQEGQRTSGAGLPLVRMRDDRSGDRLATEERTPGGWRVELAQLESAASAQAARAASALPALPALPAGWAWRPRGDGQVQAEEVGGPGLTPCHRPGLEALVAAHAAELAARRRRPPPPAPPEYAEWAARAAAAGCTLSRRDDGVYQLVEPGGQVSGYPHWVGAMARIRHLETAPPAAPPAAEAEEPDPPVPADARASYAAAEAALAADLAASPPRLRRLLRLIVAQIGSYDDRLMDEDELWDELCGALLLSSDETLAEALGEGVPA